MTCCDTFINAIKHIFFFSCKHAIFFGKREPLFDMSFHLAHFCFHSTSNIRYCWFFFSLSETPNRTSSSSGSSFRNGLEGTAECIRPVDSTGDCCCRTSNAILNLIKTAVREVDPFNQQFVYFSSPVNSCAGLTRTR